MKIRIKNVHSSIYLIRYEEIPIYVGQTRGAVRSRIRSHFVGAFAPEANSRCPGLFEFILAHPDIDKYSVEVIESVPVVKANDRERHWIAEFKTFIDGANVTRGGGSLFGSENNFTGMRAPPKAIAASVAARIGRKLTENHKQKISDANMRTENKLRLRVIRDDGNSYTSLHEAAANNGVSPSAILQALKRGNRSAGYRWRYAEDDFIEKTPNKRNVRVRCIETDQTFNSLEEVCQAHKVPKSSLSRHLSTGHGQVSGRTYVRLE